MALLLPLSVTRTPLLLLSLDPSEFSASPPLPLTLTLSFPASIYLPFSLSCFFSPTSNSTYHSTFLHFFLSPHWCSLTIALQIALLCLGLIGEMSYSLIPLILSLFLFRSLSRSLTLFLFLSLFPYERSRVRYAHFHVMVCLSVHMHRRVAITARSPVSVRFIGALVSFISLSLSFSRSLYRFLSLSLSYPFQQSY